MSEVKRELENLKKQLLRALSAVEEFLGEGEVRVTEDTQPHLPRKVKFLDERGRLVIPEYMRARLGLRAPCAVVIELYPRDNPKCLVVRKMG